MSLPIEGSPKILTVVILLNYEKLNELCLLTSYLQNYGSIICDVVGKTGDSGKRLEESVKHEHEWSKIKHTFC